MFNRYEYEAGTLDMADLESELGWWEHGGDDTTDELIEVCMILARRVRVLESKVKELEEK